MRNAHAVGEVELRRAGSTGRAQVREATTEEAAPELQSYLRRLRLVVGSFIEVTPSSPDAAFTAEAPRHPVLLPTSPPA